MRAVIFGSLIWTFCSRCSSLRARPVPAKRPRFRNTSTKPDTRRARRKSVARSREELLPWACQVAALSRNTDSSKNNKFYEKLKINIRPTNIGLRKITCWRRTHLLICRHWMTKMHFKMNSRRQSYKTLLQLWWIPQIKSWCHCQPLLS